MNRKDDNEDKKLMCKYSPNCYQKNPEHLKKYKHAPAKNFGIFDFAQKNKKRKLDQEQRHDDTKTESKPEHPRTSQEPETKNSPKVNEKFDDQADQTETLETITDVDHHKNNSMIPEENKFHSVPSDIPSFIQQKFSLKMPDDFYKFWDFLNDGFIAKNCLRKINLALVGPFDVLQGKLPVSKNEENYLLHWRHFYDPPEFQTIIMSTLNEFHIGYYRDGPEDLPCFVASNNGKDCKILPMAENIFGALISHLSSKDVIKSVFLKSEVDILIKDLKEFAKKHSFTLDTNSVAMKKRQRTVVAKTFHGAGIVVPFDKKTQLGYRPLIENYDKIKTLLSILTEAETEKEKASARSALQPIVTMANIANDECDFGTGLELGINLFSFGSPVLHNYIESLLSVAYSMLDREAFGNIIKVHLQNRRKGPKLSIADLT